MEPEVKLWRSVILRAICDAVGFTNENKSKDAHGEAVQDARRWFYDAGEDFQDICDYADFDHRRVRSGVTRLIQARQSGDHTHLPSFWRKAFEHNRMPSFTRFSEEIDALLKRG